MLVIADAERAGRDRRRHGRRRFRGQRHDTQTIVFESAYFNAAVGAANEQGARTEDRSEHAVRARHRPAPAGDGHGTRVRAARDDRRRARRAARWSTAILFAVEPTMLRLRRGPHRRASRCDDPDADIRRILEALGFALRDGEHGWDVTVPTRRVDVTREVDLIEEVARHYGFDRIPVDVPGADGCAAADRSAHHARPAAARAGMTGARASPRR